MCQGIASFLGVCANNEPQMLLKTHTELKLLMNCFQLWMLDFLQDRAKYGLGALRLNKSISKRTVSVQLPGYDSRWNSPSRIYPKAKHSDPFVKRMRKICDLRKFDYIINV